MTRPAPTLEQRATYARIMGEHLGLVGVAEIAATLGVSKQRVVQLRAQAAFPRPVAELAAGPVWVTADVTAWRAARAARLEGQA